MGLWAVVLMVGLGELGGSMGAPVDIEWAGPADIGGATSQEVDPGFSSFLELRVYSTRDGQRDRFLSYFEEHYLESQEDRAMRIWGQFRDLDDPGQFVWMRGYRTMDERAAGLMEFYTSPLWQETGPLVREMLAGRAVHVHFLEPASGADALDGALNRPTGEHDTGVVVAQVFPVTGDGETELRQVREEVIPSFLARGATSLGLFETSDEANNFPALPFIEDERVVVWFATYSSRESYEEAVAAIQPDMGTLETFVLEPGQRSRLYHRGG